MAVRASQWSSASIHSSITATSGGWARTSGPTTLAASASTVSHQLLVTTRHAGVLDEPVTAGPDVADGVVAGGVLVLALGRGPAPPA